MEKDFLANGNLEPGIHTYTIDTFESQFVGGFPKSVSRSKIYQNFRTWIDMLISVLPPRYIWLDGSYLTKKENPNDIDLIVFYAPEDINDATTAGKIQHIVNEVSRTMNCDAYLSFTFDHLDPSLIATLPNDVQTNRTYWMGQFGFDRQMNPKGMVMIPRDEVLNSVAVAGGVI